MAIRRGDFIPRTVSQTKELKRFSEIIKLDHKWCNGCKNQLPLTNFNKKSKNRYQSYCKECNKIRSKKYYADNRQKHKQDTMIRKKIMMKKIRDFIWEIQKNAVCCICGETNPLTFDFDHLIRKTKLGVVGLMYQRGNSIKKLKEEIDKCQILCSNCHRIKTHQENNSWKWKKFSGVE